MIGKVIGVLVITAVLISAGLQAYAIPFFLIGLWWSRAGKRCARCRNSRRGWLNGWENSMAYWSRG